MIVAITGASGFLGNALQQRLTTNNTVVGFSRSTPSLTHAGVKYHLCADLSNGYGWSEKLCDVDVLIHAAARVNLSKKAPSNTLAAYREVNVEGTLELAMQAAYTGVKRFIFISSIGVHGNSTVKSYPFMASSPLRAHDPYSISKAEAETGLIRISSETGMEVVIIRPPLIYGPGMRGPFLSLLRWVDRGLPLPLGALENIKSFAYVDNVVDLVEICLDHPKAANQAFLVSDDDDTSITALLKKTTVFLDSSCKLIPIPPKILSFTAGLCGKSHLSTQLLDNLQVDVQSTKNQLGWLPSVNFSKGLKATTDWLQRTR